MMGEQHSLDYVVFVHVPEVLGYNLHPPRHGVAEVAQVFPADVLGTCLEDGLFQLGTKEVSSVIRLFFM
jgi:hypothetical protein